MILQKAVIHQADSLLKTTSSLIVQILRITITVLAAVCNEWVEITTSRAFFRQDLKDRLKCESLAFSLNRNCTDYVERDRNLNKLVR